MMQMPLALTPLPQPTLDNFVVGDNAAVLNHVRSFLQVAAPPPPLYLWGDTGSGKTHLLQALVARCRDGGGSAATFSAFDTAPWCFDPVWTLVVVDSCHQLDESQQHAAFVLFTEATTHGVAFAAAGALPPADLPLREDLRTRLAWGHVFALQPLSESDTRRALNAEARRRLVDLPEDVLNYLLSRFPRDLGTLMAVLASLDHHGLSTQRRLTVPLIRDMLAQRSEVPVGSADTKLSSPSS